MDELNEWSQVGRKLGINLSSFESIQKKSTKNIVNIQRKIKSFSQNMIYIEVLTDELVENYSRIIMKLQEDLIRSLEYVPLAALRLVMVVIKGKLRLRNSRLGLKKIIEVCLSVKEIVGKMLDRPFRDILYMALFELDIMIEEIREEFLGFL